MIGYTGLEKALEKWRLMLLIDQSHLNYVKKGVNSKTHLARDTRVNFVDWLWSDSIA